MRYPGHKLGHLDSTETIGLILQYFISKPIQKKTGRTVSYIFLIGFIMFIICYVCL